MIRGFVATFLVAVFVVDAGVLRHRIADELSALPAPDVIMAAFEKIKDMKLTEVAKRLASSPYVRVATRRAATDMRANPGLREMIPHITMNSKVQQVFQKLAKEDLTVKDLANLRQQTSPDFQASVRSALDSLMADEGSRPLATHLTQAWDAKSAEDQMKHLSMALDVLDTAATDKAAADEEFEDADVAEEAATKDDADELAEADPEELEEEEEEEEAEEKAADENEEEAQAADEEEEDEMDEEEDEAEADAAEADEAEADEAEDEEEADEAEADEAEDEKEEEAAEEEKEMADPSA